MKRTVTVNLGGIVFHIDEDAHEKLNHYLQSIKAHFKNSEGGDEIIADIESRFAEVFSDIVKIDHQALTLPEIEVAIEEMGNPDHFEPEAGNGRKKDVPPPAIAQIQLGTKRRLFRNPDDKWIGGVCSGLGIYLNFDPIWFRIAFSAFVYWGHPLLLGWIGVIIYLVLWMIFPPAVTHAEKLEMYGDEARASNIKASSKSLLVRMGRILVLLFLVLIFLWTLSFLAMFFIQPTITSN